MYKQTLFKIIGSLLSAYLLILSEYEPFNWNLIRYNSSLRVMYFTQVVILWLSMFIVNIIYNALIVYQHPVIRHWSLSMRKACYFVLSNLLLMLLYIGQREVLQHIYSDSVPSEGYVHRDFIWFILILQGYLFFLYYAPGQSPMHAVIRSLCHGSSPSEEEDRTLSSPAPPSERYTAADNEETPLLARSPILPYCAEEENPHILCKDILLFYFSRKNGSYIIDVKGRRWYCNISQSYLAEHLSKNCFIQINRYTYINKRYAQQNTTHKQHIKLHKQLEKRLTEQHINLKELLKITRRCKYNFEQHLHQQEPIIEGWDENIYY